MSIREILENKEEIYYKEFAVLDNSFRIIDDKYFKKSTFGLHNFNIALLSRKNTDYFNTTIDSNNQNQNNQNQNLNLIKNHSQNLIEMRQLSMENLKENNSKASLAILIYSLLYSITTLIGKFLGMYYPEVENSATNLIRGIIVLIISQIIFSRNELSIKEELSKDLSKTKILLLRCLFGAFANFAFFQSLKNMRVSSAFTIFNVSPIITTVLSVVFLGIKISNADIFGFISCFFSVILITKPSFLFNSLVESEDKLIGIIWAIFAMLFSGISVFLNKKIGKDFHFISNLYIMGVFFILISVFVLMISENGLRTITFYSCFLAVLMSIFFFASIASLAYSLSIGADIVKILPITYSGVVINSFYNVVIFHQSFDIFDFIGSCVIIIVNVLNAFK
jgi:drug/metabolite transporter (DMT)-like permease